MGPSARLALLAAAAAVAVDRRGVAAALCTSDTNQFTVKVDLYAGELGYFTFEECGDEVMPTLGIEVGQTYTFVQEDRSNYFHPLGFAYGPDGAHDDLPELEPTVAGDGSTSDCADSATCPAPMYFTGTGYAGKYSNIDAVLNATTGETDFGLDNYEPLFFYPMREWVSLGPFSIQLNFDDDTYAKDLFYFCHIHQFMSGRIKLLKNGVPVNDQDDPPLGYEYDAPSEFDKACGTYGLEDFQLPHPQCPETFVCGAEEQSEGLQAYAACQNAANCHMFAHMTTGVKAASPTALFIHSMIPHHQQAVSTAKALLKTGTVVCDDLLDEEDPLCNMEVILREIINGQNAQIQTMRSVLKANGYPDEDKCVVEITSSSVA